MPRPTNPKVPTWKGTVRGKRWRDMPGQGSDMKKMNFVFWRRGVDVFAPEIQQRRPMRAVLLGLAPGHG